MIVLELRERKRFHRIKMFNIIKPNERNFFYILYTTLLSILTKNKILLMDFIFGLLLMNNKVRIFNFNNKERTHDPFIMLDVK